MPPEVVNGLFVIGGALIGVVGTVFVTWNTWHFKDRKRLTVTRSPLASLLDVGEEVKVEPNINILYENQPLKSLSMEELYIENTGTMDVDDFDVIIKTEQDSLLMVPKVSATFNTFEKEDIETSGDTNRRIVHIKCLKPRERLTIAYKIVYKFDGKRKRPKFRVRPSGVQVVISKIDMVEWIPDIYAEAVYEIFSQVPFLNLIARLSKPYRLYLKKRKAGAGSEETQ